MSEAASSGGLPVATRLVLATHNEHKIAELRAVLTPVVPGLAAEQVVGAGAINDAEPVEDGVTFAANALIKARAFAALTGLPVIADDSGIAVDVLGGAPGIFSARWAGRHGDDAANVELLLAQLSDVPDVHRGAAFVCAAALVTPGGTELVEIGTVPGALLRERRGSRGFGYDPVFSPEGDERSMSQMSAVEKNAISHRGRALRALAPHVARVLAG